jgi:hypothetical protein
MKNQNLFDAIESPEFEQSFKPADVLNKSDST